jgi:alkaline phosphatase D
MNTLRVPSVGPIVGHVTSTSARIWIRGCSDDKEMRTMGVAALYSNNKYVRNSVRYFRMQRQYDRTGTVDFEKLTSDTTYVVRVASLALDSSDPSVPMTDEDIEEHLPKPEVWIDDLNAMPDECVATVRTFPATAKMLSFIFGSCRYPGLFWKKKEADTIFGPLLERVVNWDKGKQPRFVLMGGDQIYADMFNRHVPLGLADTEEEFRDRYITAFTSRNMRQLLRSVPNYMILDDHEIEDNWVQGRIKDVTKRRMFQVAISAYRSYQWVHSPRNYDDQHYYSFECGDYPFFVTDGRTQRNRDDDDRIVDDNHMLGYPARDSAPGYKGQIDILCDWLIEQQKDRGDTPKFIVSASVFVPNDISTVDDDKKWKDDGWAAFPTTRKQLLQTIVDNKIQNVIFLSGDIHCSNVANIIFEEDGKALPLRAFSIVSSAFYWPWSFADGSPLGYVHDSKKLVTYTNKDRQQVSKDDGFKVNERVVMHYTAKNFQQDDNFTQVDIEPGRIIARTFDWKGKALDRSELKLG